MRAHRVHLSITVTAAAAAAVVAQNREIDPKAIERITGASVAHDPTEGVYKITLPRTDVPIKVDGRTMEPFLGFTSWAAFKAGAAAECMVMGDLVLFEDEVSGAMDACLEAGVAVTALHNHFFFDEPKVYFMHIGGEGSVDQLAGGVKKTLEAVKSVRSKTPQPAKSFGLASVPTKNAISAQPIEEILGVKGQAKDGMYKAVIGRTVRMACGCEVTKEMGVNTWAALGGNDDAALIDGDFAVLGEELQPVLRALRSSGIHVVAIHHHMVGESPRMLFLHYWGVGRAVDLARGVKSALDAQARVSTEKGANENGPAARSADSSTQDAAPAPNQSWLAQTPAQQRDQLEKHLRGLDMAMVEVGYRFIELYFAGKDGNWDYAKYQIEKIELATQLALERRPKRAASAEPFLRETVPIVKQALEDARSTRDVHIFDDAMERLRMDCMKCHVSENVPYFTVYFPEQRQSPVRTVR